jgi:hypothetical protein
MDASKVPVTTRSRLIRKLEIATNVAVLIAALLTAAFFARLFIERSGPSEPSYRAAPGTRLALPEAFAFESYDRTLILAIQEDCSYCEASMPFYREIAASANLGCAGLGLVAVLPNPRGAADALFSRNDLEIPRLANTSLASLGVTGTPTLILVDREGAVLDVWVGELSRNGEQKVLAAIESVSACS